VMKRYAEVRLDVPEAAAAGEAFTVAVSVTNITNEPLHDVTVQLQPPYMVYLMDESTVHIPLLDPGAEREIQFRALALEGGRSELRADVTADAFHIVAGRGIDVTGAGYYGGDTHSHTVHSDGVHSVADNSANMYDKRLLSWIWSTEHNKDSQITDTEQVTAQYGGRFLSISGTEITTPYGHALALGFEGVPRHDIDENGEFSWQDSINQVTSQGGLFFIAHPFEQTYAFLNPYQWSGFTGVEVWNGTWHPLDQGVNERAFRYWDELNIRGDGKVFGVAGSDAHTRDKTGDPYSKGWMPSLTKDNVLQMLGTGGFFGSNGPELRFNIDGVDMGGTLRVKGKHNAIFQIEAYDPNSNLTHIRLLKYRITGNIADYDSREIVYEADLTPLQTNTFLHTLSLPVSDNEFYRLEVRSEKAQPNNSGIGPLTGTGFAFSNPIWVEESNASNALGIEKLEYKNENKYKFTSKFGMDVLDIVDRKFDPKKLDVKVSKGAKVKSVSFEEIIGGEYPIGLLHITVEAKDGSAKSYTYVMRFISK